MAKAIISNRIYLDTTPEIANSIAKALTYKIKKKMAGRSPFGQYEIIKNYKMLPKGVMSIPSGREDLIPEGYEIMDKRVVHELPFPTPKFPLNPEQQKIYDQVDGSCFINAMVGWGKTFEALHLARKLGQKTLVVCHNTMLRDQWIKEVESLYNMPVGIIGSGEYDIDHSIVIGNIQTLTKILPKISKEFGTVIVDECLDYNSQIITLEKGKVMIGNLVNNKMPVHVLSLDPSTGVSSYKKVLNWYKNPHTNCLKISHSGGGNIKCTENHGIYSYSNGHIDKVPAETLEVGDYLLQTTTTHKSTHILNKEWKPIALGLILGDGSLQYAHSSSDSVRIRVTHGQAQFDYLEWKKSLLGDTTESISKSGYKPENIVKGVSSKSFYDIDNWYQQLYVKGHKRTITKSIASIMDTSSWALFFQDDGSASQNADTLVFSICELDEESAFNLIGSLSNLFHTTNAKQFVCSKGFRYIRLNKEDTLLFLKGINGLVHPQLQYKLSSIKEELKPFNFPTPSVPLFNEHFCVRKITKIEPSVLTGNHRFNIEVEDNHTYFANGILVANCHHVTATTFSSFLDGMYAKNKLGLSGTMVRVDGKHVLFKDFFGFKLFQPPQFNTLNPRVQIIKTGIALAEGEGWAKKMNILQYDPDYQEFVATVAKLQIAKGHKVLVIADRVEFLQNVGELIGESCVCITGGSSFEEREKLKAQIESGEKDCVAGSRQIFSEGISINILSCVILAAPIANPGLLEQIIGRIQRQHPDKLPPLAIDMHFAGGSDKAQNKIRLAFYQRQGWEVTGI